jgi:hypothetical protein
MFDERGLVEQASRERELARHERDRATAGRGLALPHHEWIGRAAKRGARERCSDRRLV